MRLRLQKDLRFGKEGGQSSNPIEGNGAAFYRVGRGQFAGDPAIELRQQNIADIGKLQLLVNCTPVGLTDSEPPVGFESLLDKIDHDNGFFIDTVYRRDQATTVLCGLADAAAVRNCDGRSMLVEQAVLAFEFWTGRRPDASLFDEALRHSPRL